MRAGPRRRSERRRMFWARPRCMLSGACGAGRDPPESWRQEERTGPPGSPKNGDVAERAPLREGSRSGLMLGTRWEGELIR